MPRRPSPRAWTRAAIILMRRPAVHGRFPGIRTAPAGAGLVFRTIAAISSARSPPFCPRARRPIHLPSLRPLAASWQTVWGGCPRGSCGHHVHPLPREGVLDPKGLRLPAASADRLITSFGHQRSLGIARVLCDAAFSPTWMNSNETNCNRPFPWPRGGAADCCPRPSRA